MVKVCGWEQRGEGKERELWLVCKVKKKLLIKKFNRNNNKQTKCNSQQVVYSDLVIVICTHE